MSSYSFTIDQNTTPLNQAQKSTYPRKQHRLIITREMHLLGKKVHRYVIFKIDEKKKEVVVEKIGGPTESYDDFAASLPEYDCRYAVFDFDFVTSENSQKSKIFFIAWRTDWILVGALCHIQSCLRLFERNREKFTGTDF